MLFFWTFYSSKNPEKKDSHINEYISRILEIEKSIFKYNTIFAIFNNITVNNIKLSRSIELLNFWMVVCKQSQAFYFYFIMGWYFFVFTVLFGQSLQKAMLFLKIH